MHQGNKQPPLNLKPSTSQTNFRDVFLEKHWRSAISRTVCDYYLEAQRNNPNDISPVIATPHHYLISIQRCGVSFVAVCMEEVPPLFVIEFLHRIVDTFQVRLFGRFRWLFINFWGILGLFFRLHREYY